MAFSDVKSTLAVCLVVLIVVGVFYNNADCQTTNEVSISVNISQTDLIFDQLKGYDYIKIQDGDYVANVGEPMLGAKVIRVALPDGMKALAVEVINSQSSVLDGEYNIYPAQPPRKIDNSDKADFVQPKAEIYNSDGPYPGVLAEFVGQTDLAGQAMAVIKIMPLQYLPSAKQVKFYNSLVLKINGESGYKCGDYLPYNATAELQGRYKSMVAEMVINPEAVQLRKSDIPIQSGVGEGSYDYVIITSSTYESSFQDLVDWKTKKGVLATIVTTTWIYNSGGYSGDTDDKIRAFVNDAYTNWGTTYFLLGGDTGVVPANSKYVNGEDVANDTYYGDFDDDWTCEVHIGRASITGTAMISTFIDKVLTYEKTPPMTSYALKAALFGFDLDDYTDGEDCKIYIDNTYFSTSWTMTNVYDSYSGTHVSNAAAAMNAGQNLVNHIDHCNETYLGIGSYNHDTGWETSDVAAFSNGDRQCIFYTIGCYANAYDYTTSISEYMVRDTNGGAVAYIGNTHSGIYYMGDTDSYSFHYDRYFFRSLFSQGYYNVGACLSDHKNDISVTDEVWQYLFTGLNLLGDPEMPIWTAQPQPLVLEHPSILSVGESSFTVHVEDSLGTSVSSALVCLYKEGEVYLTGTTNSSGNITFTLDVPTIGTLYVTATKHNYLPEESSAEAQDLLGAVAGIVRDQALAPVAGASIFCSSPSLSTTTNEYGEYVLYGFEAGVYSITFSAPGFYDTTVTGVSIAESDTTSLYMVLTPYADNVGVSAIFSPTDSVMSGVQVSIECEVHNYGTDVNSFRLIFTAAPLNSSSIEYADTVIINNMAGGATDTVTFSQQFSFALADTTYNISAYTVLAGDMYAADDSVNSTCYTVEGIVVWYGKTDLSAIGAYVGGNFTVDVYAATSPGVYAGDLHLCLGAMDDYVSAFNSITDGIIYYPLNEWAIAEFREPENDPNPDGWTSQSFLGLANISRTGSYIPLESSPALHLETATKILSFVLDASDDTTLIGQTIACLGRGVNSSLGYSNASDTLGNYTYKIVELYSPVIFRSTSGACDYMPGDVNGDDHVIGSDVTFMVNYFRGMQIPPDSCWNDSTELWFYSAGDVNGDCKLIGSDVTFLVNYFRGLQPEILWCSQTPPLEAILLKK